MSRYLVMKSTSIEYGLQSNSLEKWLECERDENSYGIATQIYLATLKAFRNLCSQGRTLSLDKSHLTMLKEELARLYLWGESFGPGEIDLALEYSEDSQHFVLGTFGYIGRLLLRGECLRYVENKSSFLT